MSAFIALSAKSTREKSADIAVFKNAGVWPGELWGIIQEGVFKRELHAFVM